MADLGFRYLSDDSQDLDFLALLSSLVLRPSSFALRPYSQSQEVQKKYSKHAQNMLVSVSFCSKRARFC
jgi:hypothetical protein